MAQLPLHLGLGTGFKHRRGGLHLSLFSGVPSLILSLRRWPDKMSAAGKLAHDAQLFHTSAGSAHRLGRGDEALLGVWDAFHSDKCQENKGASPWCWEKSSVQSITERQSGWFSIQTSSCTGNMWSLLTSVLRWSRGSVLWGFFFGCSFFARLQQDWLDWWRQHFEDNSLASNFQERRLLLLLLCSEPIFINEPFVQIHILWESEVIIELSEAPVRKEKHFYYHLLIWESSPGDI